MIQVNHLVKEFEIEGNPYPAVNGVSFHVNRGEIYGIIGLSGAGKSTLVRCLNRLEEPTEGEIFIDGVDLLKLDKKTLLQERKEIGMIFQSFNLFHQKTVYENISYPLELIKMPKDQIQRRVEELLEFIDLSDKKNAYPSEISGGQKQRVAIARALATQPKILLSDEGTSALDPENTAQILDLIRRAVKDFNMTVVMITHQMEVAKDICDRIAVMDNGKIIEENMVEELFRSPKHERTRSFIQSLQEVTEEIINPNDFSGTVVRLTYDSKTVKEPVLSRCSRMFDIDINLISGNINKLNTSDIGYMIVELQGENAVVSNAMKYLEEQGIRGEVL